MVFESVRPTYVKIPRHKKTPPFDSIRIRLTIFLLTVLEELEIKASQLTDHQRASLATTLLATLPPILQDIDEGVAEAFRRDAELESDPSAGINEAEFRAAVISSRKQ